MGMLMSFMGKGLPSSSQMLSFATGILYDQFVDKEIKDYDSFHLAVLDIFNTINMALPGKHYDVPSHKEVEDFFKTWKEAEEEKKRRKIFTDFMKKNVHLRKVDESMVITGIVAPPAAMVVKRSGETLPQLKAVKVIPDVLFVPTATLLALISVKISRKIFMAKVHGSENPPEPSEPENSHEPFESENRPKPPESENQPKLPEQLPKQSEPENLPEQLPEPLPKPSEPESENQPKPPEQLPKQSEPENLPEQLPKQSEPENLPEQLPKPPEQLPKQSEPEKLPEKLPKQSEPENLPEKLPKLPEPLPKPSEPESENQPKPPELLPKPSEPENPPEPLPKPSETKNLPKPPEPQISRVTVIY